MTNTFTREELYELVWSEPMTVLKTRFGVSDVAIAKMCRRNSIPIPNRGYWAKLQSAKPTLKPKLAQRGLGMPDTVTIGGRRHHNWFSTEQILAMEISPPPEFTEPVASLKERVRKLVGKVPYIASLDRAHPSIARLLTEDRERVLKRQSTKHSTWTEEPLFQTPFEQRRLTIVNSLFQGLHQAGASASCRGKDPQEFDVRIGEQHVSFKLDANGIQRHGYRAKEDLDRPANVKLQLQITNNWRKLEDVKLEWSDSGAYKIERQLSEIAAELFTLGEMSYRAGEISHHRWLMERKRQILQSIQENEAEAKRIEDQKLRLAEQTKISHLLRDAKAFRQARDIRQYVSEARAAMSFCTTAEDQYSFENWASWAQSEADRIDPVKSLNFRSQFRQK